MAIDRFDKSGKSDADTGTEAAERSVRAEMGADDRILPDQYGSASDSVSVRTEIFP